MQVQAQSEDPWSTYHAPTAGQVMPSTDTPDTRRSRTPAIPGRVGTPAPSGSCPPLPAGRSPIGSWRPPAHGRAPQAGHSPSATGSARRDVAHGPIPHGPRTPDSTPEPLHCGGGGPISAACSCTACFRSRGGGTLHPAAASTACGSTGRAIGSAASPLPGHGAPTHTQPPGRPDCCACAHRHGREEAPGPIKCRGPR